MGFHKNVCEEQCVQWEIVAGNGQNFWNGEKKRSGQRKAFSFNVFLIAIAQYTHRWKLNMADFERFSILSPLANTFHLFVFCFLQPSTDPCNDYSSHEKAKKPDPELSNNASHWNQVEVLCSVKWWHFNLQTLRIFLLFCPNSVNPELIRSLCEINVSAWPQSVLLLMSGVFGHTDASLHDAPAKNKPLLANKEEPWHRISQKFCNLLFLAVRHLYSGWC